MRGRRTLGLLVVLVLVVAAAGPAVATPPPPPAAYYGSLTVNGEPAKAGVTVTAEIDGEVRGSLTTTQEGAYGGAGAFDDKLQVDGENGDDGKTVTFFVNGVEADGTVTWQSGDVQRVDLTVLGDVYGSSGGGGGGGGSGGGGGGAGGQPAQGTETPQPEPDDGDEPEVERVNVTVSAQENETVSVNLTDATDADGDGVPDDGSDDRNVTLDGLDIEVKQDGDVSLNISSSDRPPADDAPSLTLDDGTEPLGYIRVEHSAPDDAIGNVTFRFRVSKARLDDRGTDPSNVALYRFTEGTWTELPTDHVGETATHYVFVATSPGLSDFATGLKRAKFQLTDAQVSVSSVAVGDDVEVRVRIENVGGADGTYLVELRLDDEQIASQQITVAAGGTRIVTFNPAFGREGTYRVAVNDVFAGEVSVAAVPTPGEENQPNGTATPTETQSPGLNGFGVGVALLAVGSLALLARRR